MLNLSECYNHVITAMIITLPYVFYSYLSIVKSKNIVSYIRCMFNIIRNKIEYTNKKSCKDKKIHITKVISRNYYS